MSERPNFAGVLAEHRQGALTCYDHPPTVDEPWWCCECGEHLIRTSRRAHLAAALNAEVDRWLADEGTREVVAEELDHVTWCESNYTRGCTCRDYRLSEARAALAALTTTTEPTAEEQR